MATATETAPQRKTLMIAGVTFEAPFKYAEGHVLSEVEAKALNQTRFENLRNNFASTVKASIEGKEGAVAQADLPAAFAEYEAAYDFASPSAGGGASRSMDPIEREARNLAVEIVKAKLKEMGRSYSAPRDASDEDKAKYRAQIDSKVEEIAAREEVVAQAKKNVAARSKSLEAISASLDF